MLLYGIYKLVSGEIPSGLSYGLVQVIYILEANKGLMETKEPYEYLHPAETVT
jgi:hypothetical protein